jgi:DNA-binding LacI/PurR family transcriptional regulator
LAERVAKQIQEQHLTPVRAGQRLASVRELAADLGVSVTTIRAAQALLANKGLLEIHHGSGCYVSRSNALGVEPHIAILSEYNLLRSPRGAVFYAHVMDELRVFLEAKEHASQLYIGHVLLDQPPADTITCSGFLKDLACDRIGGVAALATLPLNSWTMQAKAKGIPIVGMGGLHYRFSGSIDPDFAGAIHHAVVRLVGSGRRHPAFIGWDEGGCDSFTKVVAGSGLTPNPRWVRTSLKPLEAGAGWSDFREIWAAGNEKPDSVIFGDDVLFQDALQAIQAAGVRIPDELEVVVMANKGIPLPQPFPYTRMDCDPAEVAAAMGSLLLQCMASQPPTLRQISIPYRVAKEDEADEAGRETEVVNVERISSVGRLSPYPGEPPS